VTEYLLLRESSMALAFDKRCNKKDGGGAGCTLQGSRITAVAGRKSRRCNLLNSRGEIGLVNANLT